MLDESALVSEYHPELQCGLLTVRACLVSHQVRLYFPAGECCDMAGTIAYAERIDPAVCFIDTFSGDDPDTYYQKLGSTWQAYTR